MATQYADIFAALAAPFETAEVKERSQSGRTFSYITARVVMNRLDNVLGPENWTEVYFPGEKSVMCTLTITLPDGKQLSKSDAGGYAGMADSGDDDKSGFSDSFKRAAVKLGIGRYLYKDGVPAFVTERYDTLDGPAVPVAHTHTPAVPTGSGGSSGYAPRWGNAPEPAKPARQAGRQARPAARHEGREEERYETARAGQGQGQDGNGGLPRTGRALFAYLKDVEQKHRVGVLKYINSFIKLQEMPSRIVDLDSQQVAIVYEEVQRKLSTIQHNGADAYEEALSQ